MGARKPKRGPAWGALMMAIESEDDDRIRCTECNGRAWGWCYDCVKEVVRLAYEAGQEDGS